MRWRVLDDAAAGFAALVSEGEGWGNSRGVTALAAGDVDGDGRDEIVIGRNGGGNMRRAVHDDAAAGFAQIHSDGAGWGASRGTSALAIGETDGDAAMEVAFGPRAAATSSRRWATASGESTR